MTKSSFLSEYRKAISALPWSSNPDKLERFLESCRATIENETTSWNHDGESSAAAWRAIGGKGKPTLKALRALAE
jgi:uncharacterized protein YukE